jgi:hypothetical protein
MKQPGMAYKVPPAKPPARPYEHRTHHSLADGLEDFARITPEGPCRDIMNEAVWRLRDWARGPAGSGAE